MNYVLNCSRTETAFHYFLKYLYIVQRKNFLPSLTMNIILNGDERIDAHGNINLHEAVSKYITQTNRF